MPREGISYHVDDLWRSRLRERLDELEQSQSWLSNESGIPRSMLSELLSGIHDSSTYLPEIHKALGWDPPLGPLLTKDDEELLRLANRMTPEQRARLTERALALDDEAKKKR